MAAKHILYLSYDGMTDPLGGSQVLPYLRGIAKNGYRFSIISFEKKDRFNEDGAKLAETLRGEGINWIPQIYHKFPPVLSTLWDVFILNRVIDKLFKSDPFQLIHCRSYITALAGQRAKKKWGIPFLFDMRGFYADERVDGGLWKKDNVVTGSVYRYFKNKEITFLNDAFHTIVLTHAGKKIIQEGKLTGIPFTGNISVIPCCADMDYFNYETIPATARSDIRKQLGITEQTMVLGYSGSVGTWYMLPEMIRFFKAFQEKFLDSKFVFLTRDSPSHILQEAEKNGLKTSDLIIRAVNRAEMAVHLAVFDYSVFFILPSFSKQASSPTKQGELMGMGIPVICNAGVGDTEHIVKRLPSGVVLDGFSDTEMQQALDRCLVQEFDREKIRGEGQFFYGLNEGVNSYTRIYDSFFGE